jgi:hypothetical protein
MATLIHRNHICLLGKPIHHLQDALLTPRSGEAVSHHKCGV